MSCLLRCHHSTVLTNQLSLNMCASLSESCVHIHDLLALFIYTCIHIACVCVYNIHVYTAVSMCYHEAQFVCVHVHACMCVHACM